MAAAATSPLPETASRITKSGRKLTYCLTVIQQPERARACGSGAKSSADRRPVDPPPVVELRIFEGEGESKEDVTFSYDANFFLFATLEVARPIAHGRGLPQPPAPQVPVLTGMPVSGMAYLDRPTEAGYFIFPDLSVRHEGKYRLSFNLYEETKNPKDDGDAESANETKPKISTGPGTPDSSFDWRLEVKSAMFTVFSAKKFPGLAESTVLSRTVAEQGCRVRIRRDVRMRRREGKAGGDYEDVNEDDYVRPGRPPEQSHDPYRERSHSGSPAESERAPYQEPQRRISGEYAPNQYSHYPPTPGTPHSQYPPAGAHLSFLDRPAQQYSAPQPHFAQPQPPAPQSYQQAPPTYHQPAPPAHLQYRGAPQPPPQQPGYHYDRQYPQSAHPTNPSREPYEPEYRRASVGYPPQQQPQRAPYPAVDSSYNRAPYHGYPPRPHSPVNASPVNLAPLKMPPLEPKYESLTSPPGPLSVNRIAPPLPSPAYERAPERSNSYSQNQGPLPTLAEAARNGKRSFDAVFSSSATNQPLYNGMRPSSPHNNGPFDDDDDMALDALKMQYKRADGNMFSRELPTLE